jgi:hypothetical protein
MDNMDSAFEKDTKKKKDKDFTPVRNALQAKVGQLTMEVEWLQKKCVQLGLDIDDKWLSPTWKNSVKGDGRRLKNWPKASEKFWINKTTHNEAKKTQTRRNHPLVAGGR